MNYYEHHLGDYDGATAHLSWLEDCAYRRLICLYYRTEAAIPADLKQACRLVRAVSKQERDAVEQVLTEFFELRADGWHNARCDQDIGTYQDTAPDREAKRENAKERQRRSRDRRRELFEALRALDVVPAWDAPTRLLESLLSQHKGQPVTPVTPPVTAPVTRDDTATQTPPPRHHTPEEIQGRARERATPPPRPPDVSAQTWADWLSLRRSKKAPVTATVLDGARSEASKAGLDLDAFLRVWCTRGSQGLQAEWLKPAERGHAASEPSEPAWRREQRERNEAFLGPAAAKRSTTATTTATAEVIDVTSRLLG